MSETQRRYVPAAGRDLFLPLYDPFVKLFGGDAAREALLEQAALRAGQRVLDIGCGTGTMAVQIKRRHPEVEVVGLDPDSKALTRAKRKATQAGVSVQFDQGFSDELPYPDAAFDRVFSSFMFHHLGPDAKEKTLHEVRRVLKPGGGFHLMDFGGPESGGHGFLAHLLHSSKQLRDNASARILTRMSQAGFVEARKVGHRAMIFGRIVYYQAAAPGAAANAA